MVRRVRVAEVVRTTTAVTSLSDHGNVIKGGGKCVLRLLRRPVRRGVLEQPCAGGGSIRITALSLAKRPKANDNAIITAGRSDPAQVLKRSLLRQRVDPSRDKAGEVGLATRVEEHALARMSRN